MKRAVYLSIALLAACSAFGSDPGASVTDGGGADASTDTALPLTAPVFINSRELTFAAPPITLLSPAGVRPDDLLVSAWLSGPSTSQRLPPDWIELGRADAGDPFNGGVTTLVLGYHVLSATENDDTTYTFDGSGGQIVTIAYRNVQRKQPITPVTVSSIQTEALGGGLAALDVPPFDTRGTSLPLYIFAIIGSTTYPILPDLDRVEATNSLAAYRARTPSLAMVTVAGPRLEITVAGAAPKVLVASLAVVAGP
jgi:hypothetical protein